MAHQMRHRRSPTERQSLISFKILRPPNRFAPRAELYRLSDAYEANTILRCSIEGLKRSSFVDPLPIRVPNYEQLYRCSQAIGGHEHC